MCPKVPVTIRLSAELAETLAEEADEQDRSRSEYIRTLLRNRDRIRPTTRPNTSDYSSDYTTEHNRLRQRVEQLETEVFGGERGQYPEIEAQAAEYTVHDDHAANTDGDAADTDTRPRGWRDVLADDLGGMGVADDNRERVEALAEYLREHGHLSRKAALDADVVTEWGWSKAKDLLTATSLVERPDQRTWVWTGAEQPPQP